jgi:hypothetical protein
VSYVYFFRPKGQDGPIKVGTSSCPAGRMVTYMAWSPVPLEICAQIEFGSRAAAREAERKFHTRYDEHRLHHEWFAAHPLILRDIDMIRRHVFRLTSLPAPMPRPRVTSDAIREFCCAPTQRVRA